MGALKSAISRLSDAPASHREPPSIPSVTKSASRIELDAVQASRDSGIDHDQFAARISRDLESNILLDRRSLQNSVWCLWATNPALAENGVLLQRLVEQIIRSGRRRIFRALAASYLQSFRKDLPGLVAVSSGLSAQANELGAPYTKLHADLAVFDPNKGCFTVAGRALEGRCSVPDILRKSGLGAQTTSGGFAQETTLTALARLQGDADVYGLERLDRVKILALRDDKQLHFEASRAAFANALLLPYRDRRAPDKSVRDKSLELLLDVIGDPRSRSDRWTTMPEARQIALRWFAEQSLRQFLDVVDQVADPNMWKYRRAFWEAVYNKDLIDAAWVVFDASGGRAARSRYGQNTRFAEFSGGVQPGHAVLLLKIGGSLVAEWSHNGRCHIWNDGNDGPRLFRPSYTPFELRATRSGNTDGPRIFSHTHASPDTYSWQEKVAGKIFRLTGVRLARTEYRI
jgi:hypothetical protein